MKIQVYQEQYKSKKAHHTPEEIGFGYDLKNVAGLAGTLLSATYKKVEQDDEFNSARIEADTRLAADKMHREFKETANPDRFDTDIEDQQASIQNLIAEQSQKFKLPKHQTAFKEKMTRNLEVSYMDKTLDYGYKLQEARYKELGQSAFDSYKAQLLDGNSFVTIDDVMGNMRDYYTTLAKRYNIPKEMLDSELDKQNTSIVKSYAYGMVNKDPQLVKDLMVGNNFTKYKDYKDSIGEGFTMQQFWQNDDLQQEYRESEFGAKYTDVIKYLDYNTRVDLWKLANENITKADQDKAKLKALENSKSGWELDKQRDAAIAQAKSDGKLMTSIMGTSKITAEDDPILGSVNAPITFGEIHKGRLDKGNSYSEGSQNFAKGLSGKLAPLGYEIWLTSNTRPGDTDSKHQDGSAIDMQIFVKNNKTGKKEFTDKAVIDGYKAALGLYKNDMRKNATILEVDPNRLDYIKKQLEAEGIDTSYINWEHSKKYGAEAAKEGRQHIHFGVNPKATYDKTNSGSGATYEFLTQQGRQRYLQKRADGKTPQEAYDAARQDELDIMSALKSEEFIQSIVTTKNKETGRAIDPSQYGKYLVYYRNEITADKNMSDLDRLIALTALDKAEAELPKLQEKYRTNPVDFILETRQATNAEDAKIIQMKQYGVAPDEVVTMSEEEAKTRANQIYEKWTPEESVAYIQNLDSTADLKAIKKYWPKSQKANLLLFSKLASDSMTSEIVDTMKDWETVQLKISQSKDFGAGWEAKITGKFRKNKALSGYLADVDKLAPEESLKLLDALNAIYAHRRTNGATGDDDDIIDDIVKESIGSKFSAVTIRTPRYSTNLNLSTQFNSVEQAKITEVSGIAAALGPRQSSIFLAAPAEVKENNLIDKEINLQHRKTVNDTYKNINSTLQASSSFDGKNMVFTWEDPKHINSRTALLSKKNMKPIGLSYKDLVSVYNEADKLKEQWATKYDSWTGKKRYSLANPGTKENRPGFKKFLAAETIAKESYFVSEDTARKYAIQYVLSKKYPWLNQSKDIFEYKGNINLYNRPQVRNADGSVSTVRTISVGVNIDGKEKQMLIPSVSDEGKIMSKDEAYKYWRHKKQHLGIYDTVEEANNAADTIHKQQERHYLGRY